MPARERCSHYEPTINIMGIAIDRVVNAKRVEGWAILDHFGLMQQLGADQES